MHTSSIKRPNVAKANVARREAADARARVEALKDWKRWSQNPTFMLGLGLYIGEGSKTHRELVFTNADPDVMRRWKDWCSLFLPGVPMKLSIQVSKDVSVLGAKRFWKRTVGLDSSVYVNRGGTKGSGKFKHSKLKFGTARLRAGAGGTEAFVKMEFWMTLALSYL